MLVLVRYGRVPAAVPARVDRGCGLAPPAPRMSTDRLAPLAPHAGKIALLRELEQVAGNKSFEETVRSITNEIMRRAAGSPRAYRRAAD